MAKRLTELDAYRIGEVWACCRLLDSRGKPEAAALLSRYILERWGPHPEERWCTCCGGKRDSQALVNHAAWCAVHEGQGEEAERVALRALWGGR